jgi:hypothetical protein
MAILGKDIHLYLDDNGHLLITDRKRADLTYLGATTDFRLDASLHDVVRAEVCFIVGGVDLQLPLDQAKFVVADEEADGELLQAVKRQIEARRTAAAAMGQPS